MASTVRSIVTSVMRLLGVNESGESPDGDIMNDCMAALTSMLDSWSNNSLLIYNRSPISFPLVAGQQTYTLGVGGQWDTTNWSNGKRPVRIERAYLTYQNTVPNQAMDMPIDILNVYDWSAIPLKLQPSPIPTKLYDDGANPLRNVSLWPVPSVAQTITLWLWEPLIDLNSGLDQVLTFPPGYERAIKYNLAVEFASEIGKDLPDTVAQLAIASMQGIKSINAIVPIARCGSGISGPNVRTSFNWRTGE